MLLYFRSLYFRRTFLNNNNSILDRILKYNSLSYDDLLNPKLSTMAIHPFLFLRATAEEFYKTMSEEPFASREIFNNKLKVWSPGDQHIGNYEFAGRGGNGDEIDFRLQDFDEAFETNPFYDILRLTSSLYYFIEEYNISIGRKFPDMFMILEPTLFVDIFLDSYKNSLKLPNDSTNWSEFPFLNSIKESLQSTSVNPTATKFIKDGKFRDDSKKLIEIDEEETYNAVSKSITSSYPDFTLLDIRIRKVAGIGSSHLKRFYFILKDKNGTTHLMELKEQRKPAQIFYLKKERKRFKNKFSEFDNAQIQIKGIDKMLGASSFDERIMSVNVAIEGKIFNFISRTIPNKKLKIKEEILLQGITNDKSNIEVLQSRLVEYVKLAGIKLANAHYNSLKESNKDYFLENINYYLTDYRPRLKGIIKHTYNSITLLYRQFVREYFSALGTSHSLEEAQELLSNMYDISIDKNSSQIKKLSQDKINNSK